MNGSLLKFSVRDQQHRRQRRSHGDLVGAYGRLGEMLQRDWQIVPLHIVAHHRSGILDGVGPFHAGPPHGRVNRIADNDVHGRPVAVRVVDPHCRML